MRPEELETYAGLGGTGWLADVVRNFWKDGDGSPDRCFVAEHEGRPVGRAFFHQGSAPEEPAMFGTYIDRTVDFLEIGRALLDAALARLRDSGANGVVYAIYDIYDPDPVRYQELIESVGFRQYQEKKRHVWQDSGAVVEVPSRLVFRPLAAVGEDAFSDALRRVTEGTLDCEDKASIAKVGARESARRYVAMLKEADFEPTWWLLGYLADERLCGLVVPQKLSDAEGTIGYIGVVPELRGSGYGCDLLVKGMALLLQNGFKTIVTETDSENLPFLAEIERAGYRHHGTMRSFRCDLVPGRDTPTG